MIIFYWDDDDDSFDSILPALQLSIKRKVGKMLNVVGKLRLIRFSVQWSFAELKV